VQSYYDGHKQQFTVPDRVHAAHILISPKPGKDGKPDDAAAKAKAEDILNKVKAGGDFAALAKANSDDPGSAAQGGDLGFQPRGTFVPEFDKAAFALNPGQISDLVHTSFGYHIIKTIEKQPSHQQPLDEVRAQIESTLRQQKAQQAVNKYVDQVQSDVKSEGLDKAAQKFGLTVQTTDFVTQNDALPGVGSAPEAMQAAFSVSKGTPAVSRVPAGFVVLEPTEIQPPATPTFEQAKSQVEQQFRAQQAQQQLTRKTQELADRAKAENDLKKAAKETGATFKTSDLVGAQGVIPEIGPIGQGPAQVAFTLDKGQLSGPLTSQSAGFVLQVADKQLPPAEDFGKQKGQLRNAILDQKRQQDFMLYAEETRERFEKEGKIKFNADEQKRLGMTGNPMGQGQ
jgi:peptidyl-prolyl cis-trans isomerase D